jgi:hypothetical protein
LFFEKSKEGTVHPVTSAITRDELRRGPRPVWNYFEKWSSEIDILDISDDALLLKEAYHQTGVISEKWSADALHVAIATTNACDVIVSWNFKHIVNYQRIPKYNATNRLNGYNELLIVSPMEIVNDET